MCFSVDRLRPCAGRGGEVRGTRAKALHMRLEDEVPPAPVVRDLGAVASDPKTPRVVAEIGDVFLTEDVSLPPGIPPRQRVERGHRMVRGGGAVVHLDV